MTEIRSYRQVFDLERRIYSVDRLRLNPTGVPVRGVLYFLALLVASLASASLPVMHLLASELPWFLRDIVLPGVAATVLGALRLEGRSFHLAAHALVRHRLEPRRLATVSRRAGAARRWYPPQLLFLPDGSDARLRSLLYTGPGSVLVSVEHERRGRAVERDGSAAARPGVRAELELSVSGDARALTNACVISLGPRARMRVRPSGRGRGCR
jgi:hypothetical protein